MSSDIKQVFLDQFAACHDEPNWFVPLNKVLDGLTVEQAMWKESRNTNSIWQIVSHLSFWNERYLQRFKEEPVEETKIESNDDTFTYNAEETVQGWERAVEKANNVMLEWRKAIAEADEDKLTQGVRSGTNDLWSKTLANIIIHNAYHIGQILQIRKQQGSWDPKNGVH
ncbi:DinB family protein [Fredinandcohnia humi]